MPGSLIDEQTTQQEQAQALVKKLSKWTIGVALSTLVLLALSTLLVFFAPPVAAVILPIFAAIGSWSPLLAFTVFLPSIGLGIATFFATRSKDLQQTRVVTNTDSISRSCSSTSLGSQTSEKSNDEENTQQTRYSLFKTDVNPPSVSAESQNLEISVTSRNSL